MDCLAARCFGSGSWRELCGASRGQEATRRASATAGCLWTPRTERASRQAPPHGARRKRIGHCPPAASSAQGTARQAREAQGHSGERPNQQAGRQHRDASRPHAQVKLLLAPLLLDARGIGAADLDHASSRRVGGKPGAPKVRAEVIDERGVTKSDRHMPQWFVTHFDGQIGRLDPRTSWAG